MMEAPRQQDLESPPPGVASWPPGVQAIVLAKWPDAGGVKSRLVATGLTEVEAQEIARSMLLATVERLRVLGAATTVAVTPGSAIPLAKVTIPWASAVIDQGVGDLGERILAAWKASGGGPAVVLGMDAPDVPSTSLCGAAAHAADGRYAIGPTSDGGYWCLAGPRPHVALTARIDWGTAVVYHQTLSRAADAGLAVATAPSWEDVDDLTSLAELRRRLTARAARGASGEPDASADEPLVRLRRTVERILWERDRREHHRHGPDQQVGGGPSSHHP